MCRANDLYYNYTLENGGCTRTQVKFNDTIDEDLKLLYGATRYDCHITCSACFINTEKYFGRCLFCKDGRMSNHSGICTCPKDEMLHEDGSCSSYSRDFFLQFPVLEILNMAAIYVLSTVSMSMPNMAKLADVGQIISLLYFAGVPHFQQSKLLLRSLRYANLAPIIPNFVMNSAFKKTDSGFDYPDVHDQAPPIGFYQSMFSSNLLANMTPLLVTHLLTGLLYLLVKLMKGTSFLTLKIKSNFNYNFLILVHLLTLQESFMLVMLQFQNMKFNNALNAFGGILAVGLFLYILGFLYYILKKMKPNLYVDDESETDHSVLFMQSPSKSLSLNRYYALYVIIIKFACVLLVVFMKDKKSSKAGLFVFLCVLYVLHDVFQAAYAYYQSKIVMKQLVSQLIAPIVGMGILLWIAAPLISNLYLTNEDYQGNKSGYEQTNAAIVYLMIIFVYVQILFAIYHIYTSTSAYLKMKLEYDQQIDQEVGTQLSAQKLTKQVNEPTSKTMTPSQAAHMQKNAIKILRQETLKDKEYQRQQVELANYKSRPIELPYSSQVRFNNQQLQPQPQPQKMELPGQIRQQTQLYPGQG